VAAAVAVAETLTQVVVAVLAVLLL